MKFVLPKLPYKPEALAPTLSERQVNAHYAGHLRGYIDSLNKMPEVAGAEKTSLETFILRGKHDMVDNRLGVLPPGEHTSKLFNVAAQVYNHTFYFKCLAPKGGGEPKGDIKDIIEGQYGSYDNFKKKMIAKANNLFGSGYVWVTLDDEGQLEIIKGLDAETPFVYKGLSPIIGIDVWEHAYYLDYQRRRGEYVKKVMENLINWDFANKNLRFAG